MDGYYNSSIRNHSGQGSRGHPSPDSGYHCVMVMTEKTTLKSSSVGYDVSKGKKTSAPAYGSMC